MVSIDFDLQRSLDEDCLTELAVHYGKTKKEMESSVSEVSNKICSPLLMYKMYCCSVIKNQINGQSFWRMLIISPFMFTV